MNLDRLKESTEKLIVLLDIYDKLGQEDYSDQISLKASKYKLNYMKEKLILNSLENKKICEDMINRLKRNIK